MMNVPGFSGPRIRVVVISYMNDPGPVLDRIQDTWVNKRSNMALGVVIARPFRSPRGKRFIGPGSTYDQSAVKSTHSTIVSLHIKIRDPRRN